MVVWPMVTDDDLEARIRRSFELVDTMYAAEGWIYRTGDGLGVMSLIPPDSGARQRQIDILVARAMKAITPDGGERYARFWAWIEAGHPAVRHWLLDQLAVEPGAQGRGIGTAMVRLAMARATADGVPLLLETGSERNVAFYERLGFGMMRHADAPEGGPHIWFMRWDPGPRPTRGAAGSGAPATPPGIDR